MRGLRAGVDDTAPFFRLDTTLVFFFDLTGTVGFGGGFTFSRSPNASLKSPEAPEHFSPLTQQLRYKSPDIVNA